MIKIATVCSGIGSPEQALKNLGVEHEIPFACEIDKYARQTYLSNFQPKLMLDDMTKQTWEGEGLYSDLFVGGIPCQSFSLAGKRLGELDPRGLLFYDFYRYVKIQQPKCFIIENVKGLLSDDNGKTFRNWIQLLGRSENTHVNMFNHPDSLEYNLHWKVLNSKDFGVPQNRERVFIIGIRKDLPNTFRFPIGERLEIRLKDILEINVDEKYYLSDKMLNYMHTRKSNFNGGKINYKSGNDIASCINASSKSLDISDNIIIDGEVTPNSQAGKIYNTKGISPTITAGTHGYALGYINEPICVAMRGRNPDNSSDRTPGVKLQQTLEPNSQGTTNTITSVQKDNLILEPNIINPLKGATQFGWHFEQNVFSEDSITRALKSSEGSGNKQKVIRGHRIRRLTPLECFRLQGFDDTFVKPCSDSQTYKQAGNTITVSVIQAIIERLIDVLNQ